MEHIDHQILRIMRKVSEDHGTEWVSRWDIERHPSFDMNLRGDWKREDSLQRLNNLGKILKSPRGFGYKRLRLE